MSKEIHILCQDNSWVAQEKDGGTVLGQFETRDAAVEWGIDVLQRSSGGGELVVHHPDGKVDRVNSPGFVRQD